VIVYAREGEIEFQVEGRHSEILKSGSAFRAANGRITKFENLANDKPAKFLAVYPRSPEQTIITILEASSRNAAPSSGHTLFENPHVRFSD
jgi:hypothetical protein